MLVIDLLRVNHVLRTHDGGEVLINTHRQDLAGRKDADVLRHVPTGRHQNIFDVLRVDGILFIRELEHFNFMNTAAGAVGELLRNIAALEAGQNMEAVFAEHTRDGFNADVDTAAKIGHVSVVVLIGIHQRALDARFFHLSDQRLLARAEFVLFDAQVFIKFRRAREDLFHLLSLLHPTFHFLTSFLSYIPLFQRQSMTDLIAGASIA